MFLSFAEKEKNSIVRSSVSLQKGSLPFSSAFIFLFFLFSYTLAERNPGSGKVLPDSGGIMPVLRQGSARFR
jgi:hypothetical protein